MPTPNFGLPLYTIENTAELDVLLNGQSNAIDAALAANEFRTGGTDAQRVALAAPRRKEGLEFYATDTNREWIYDGTNWVTNQPGVYLIQPTSVTGGTIVNGGVEVSSGTAVVINGVFSSRFRSYRIVADFTLSAVGGLDVTLCAAGTPSTTGYYVQFDYASGTTVGASYAPNIASLILATYSGTLHQHELLLSRPALAQATSFQTFDNIPTAGAFRTNGYHSPTTAYDGIRFAAGSGNFTTGRFAVYGLA